MSSTRALCQALSKPHAHALKRVKRAAVHQCREVQACFSAPVQLSCRRNAQLSSLVVYAGESEEEYDAEFDAMDRMEKSIAAFEKELAGVRAGRAQPSMLSTITVDYYGTQSPLQNVATVSAPDAATIVVKPFDKSSMKDIEDAIMASDLGLTPNNDGTIIRINVPQLTEERRKQLVKVVQGEGETAKVSVRNVRRDVLKKSGKLDLSEDETKALEDDIQKLTNSYVAKIDKMLEKKTKELTTV